MSLKRKALGFYWLTLLTHRTQMSNNTSTLGVKET